MVKRIISLYIDVETLERHKVAGTNISAVCNEFLKTYFQDDADENVDHEKEVQLLRARLAKANAGLEAQKQKEKVESSKKRKSELGESIAKLRKLHIEKQGGSHLATERFKALFDATMEEFGLLREDLVKKIY